MFEVRHEGFTGPMEKLLELIEARHIEISRVNLAEVTGDFIAYVEKLGESVSPTSLSDFVVIASRLLVLKSKILLPTLELTGEEEADIMDLEQRLKLYREFKAGSVLLEKMWNARTPLLARPLLRSLGEQTSFFYPSAQVNQTGLREALERLLHVMSGLAPETRTVQNSLVSLQEKIIELTERLRTAPTMTLKGRAGKHEKEEVIVMFLAVLHMLANQIVSVEQGDTFGDIILTHQDAGEGADAFATGKLI
jgi:segregation and condensation protein A